MKKLLKGALSLAMAASVGVPQIWAETVPSYVIEVKSKKYSKQTTKGLYGLVYTEAYNGYGDANWPLVECYTPFVEANDAFIATDETGTSKKFLIRQFGVSKGVVYWINPTQNVIYYWNTFTGEVGTDTPEKGVRGSATPTRHKGLNYACTDIPGQSGFAYPFSGAQTGIGSVTQDWAGNIVHQWNNVSGAGINTPTQGYAVYKSPAKFGQLIDFEPRLSDMTTQTMSYLRRTIVEDGDGLKDYGDVLKGTGPADHTQSNYYSTTAPNPNWIGDKIDWINNWYYHAWNSELSGATKKVVDFMGASGNLYGNDGFVESDYFWGYWGGQVFHTYNGYTFGNMFADGQYSNWYLNYDLFIETDVTVAEIISKTGKYGTYFGPGATPLGKYPREYFMRECDVLDYFWSIPIIGWHESSYTGGYEWRFKHQDLQTDENGNNLSMYTSSHPRYSYKMTGGYDAMNVPEVDSIKGHRVLIHNMWLQYWPENVKETKNGVVYNMRDGQIQIRSCSYDGTFNKNGKNKNGTPNQWPGSPKLNYNQVGYGYGYNKQTNDYVNVVNSPNFTATNTSVNCWSELERCNDNVFALYTNVPGKGFSKYYITAVEQNNPVTITGISQKFDSNNNIVNTISWTPQEHDRGTMHRYQIYYRTKKAGVYENAQTIDGATRYPWTLAGVKTVEYAGNNYAAGGTFSYDHIAPYGIDANGNYDRQYEYMIMPIYDVSSHYGTEAIYPTLITSKAPVCPVSGTFKQETDLNANGDTLYSFNIKLEPKVDMSKVGASSAQIMLVVPQDESTREYLADNTAITAPTGVSVSESNATESTYTIYNTNDLTVEGYHVVVSGFEVGANGELPSLTWHNVNPEKEYNVKVYVVATSSSYFTPSEVLTTTLVVPELVWSTTPADFYKLIGDYGGLTKSADMPIGSFRRIDPETDQLDTNPSNPVTLNNANYYGTKGSVLKPVRVTKDVLGTLVNGKYENAGWAVAYGIYVNDEKADAFLQMQLENQLHSAAYSACYSNVSDVVCDMIGLKVDYDEVPGEDGRLRKIYNPTQKTYKARVEVAYRRLDANGKQDGMEIVRTTYADIVIGSTSLPELGVENTVGSTVVGALYQRDGSHFYYNDENTNGYYQYYYDAAMLFNWEEYTPLNRYVGYYGASKMTCYGHYESDAEGNRLGNEWVEYHAGSVLPDSHIDGYNSYNPALTNGKIGYDGSNNWSYQAIINNKLPMQIHYVHGGNTSLVTGDALPAATETAASDVKFDVTLTAEYPIVNYNGQNASFMVAEDPETYDVPNGYMNVMTVPTKLSDMYVTSTTITTGVEGILTEACGGVKLYPNPVGSTFTLQAPMTIGEVRIYTMDGQLVKVVKDVDDTTVKINVDELPQGMYIVNTLGVAKMMIKM